MICPLSTHQVKPATPLPSGGRTLTARHGGEESTQARTPSMAVHSRCNVPRHRNGKTHGVPDRLLPTRRPFPR